MFGYTAWDIIGWVFVGGAATCGFAWGKMKDLWQPRVIAVIMMVFPYFISKGPWLWVIGLSLTVALFFAKD